MCYYQYTMVSIHEVFPLNKGGGKQTCSINIVLVGLLVCIGH